MDLSLFPTLARHTAGCLLASAACLTAVLVGAPTAGAVQGEAAPPAAKLTTKPTVQRATVVDWAPKMDFAPIPKVEVIGDGPIPLLLIPGIAQDWTVFRTFMERNRSRYTTYAVTLPGFGGTPEAPLPENSHFKDLPVLRNAVQAILKVVDDYKIDCPVIGGYELGAHIAMWVAMDNQEKFRGIINIEGQALVPVLTGNPNFDPVEREEVIRAKIFTPMKDIPEPVWKKSLGERATSLVTDPRRAFEIGEMITTPTRGAIMEHTFEYYMSDISLGLPKLEIPMIVIVPIRAEIGKQPELTRRQWRQAFGPANKTSLVFFEDCRPYVMDEMPEKLDKTVDDWLSGRTVERALVGGRGSGVPEGGLGPKPPENPMEAPESAPPSDKPEG